MRTRALLLLLAVPGCALAHEGGSGPGVDSGGILPLDTGPPAASHARTYVIAHLQAEPPLDFDAAWGFDLDGMVGGPAGTCADQQDFVSPVTGASGVDNQFGTLVPTFDGVVGADGLDGVYRDRIQMGDLIAVIEVSGIDSETNDPSVQVHVVLAQVAAGGAPTPSSVCPANVSQATCLADQAHGCNWSMQSGSCSGIASGQHYAPRMDFGTTVGAISGGRLSATATGLPLKIFIGSMSLPLLIHDLRFAGRLSGDAIVDGELGGTVRVSELQDAFNSMGFMVDITSFVSPDLMPNVGGLTCTGISTGMAFAAIGATLD